jgi:hypothetical protein
VPAFAAKPCGSWARQKGANMAGKKKWMTMEQAITILRASGWKVDVDEVEKKIFLQDPSPDVNWLHLLRRRM